MAAFAGLALATLWQVRDASVYPWTASGLAGALYYAVSAGALAAPMEAQSVPGLLANMHDGLGSQLASAKIRFERGTLSTGQAGELLQECVNDLHVLVDTLRGSGDDLRAAISDLRYRLDRRLEGVGTRLLWSVQLDEASAIPSAVVLNLLRGVQEAITNALKDAHAREIRVEAVYGSDTGVDLPVQDDGRGIGDTSALSGRGISSMRRRAFEAGATFAIEPGPGGGTRVSFRLPTRVA